MATQPMGSRVVLSSTELVSSLSFSLEDGFHMFSETPVDFQRTAGRYVSTHHCLEYFPLLSFSHKYSQLFYNNELLLFKV
jgi:hypothetical protein